MSRKEKKYILSYYKYENGIWEHITETVVTRHSGDILQLILPPNVFLDAVSIMEKL